MFWNVLKRLPSVRWETCKYSDISRFYATTTGSGSPLGSIAGGSLAFWSSIQWDVVPIRPWILQNWSSFRKEILYFGEKRETSSEELQAIRQPYWRDLEEASLKCRPRGFLDQICSNQNQASHRVFHHHWKAMSSRRKKSHCGRRWRWHWYHTGDFDEHCPLHCYFWIFDRFVKYNAFVSHMLVLGYLSESLGARMPQNASCFCLRFWQSRSHSTANKITETC